MSELLVFDHAGRQWFGERVKIPRLAGLRVDVRYWMSMDRNVHPKRVCGHPVRWRPSPLAGWKCNYKPYEEPRTGVLSAVAVRDGDYVATFETRVVHVDGTVSVLRPGWRGFSVLFYQEVAPSLEEGLGMIDSLIDGVG